MKVHQMVQRHRRKGGPGRKPRGDFRRKTENFSTRITADTRAAMEREAEASGRSKSQVAEELIRLGLEEKARRASTRPTRALGFLIERLAMSVGGAAWVHPTKFPLPADKREKLVDQWRTVPFRYEALKIAVGLLLGALQPEGDIVSPIPAEAIDRVMTENRTFEQQNPNTIALWRHIFAAPENLASWAVFDVIQQLNGNGPFSDVEVERFRQEGPDGTADLIAKVQYGMRDARRDLGLDVNEVDA